MVLGIVGSVSGVGEEFHVRTPDNVKHTALSDARDVAVAADGSVYVLTANNVKKLDSSESCLKSGEAWVVVTGSLSQRGATTAAVTESLIIHPASPLTAAAIFM